MAATPKSSTAVIVVGQVVARLLVAQQVKNTNKTKFKPRQIHLARFFLFGNKGGQAREL